MKNPGGTLDDEDVALDGESVSARRARATRICPGRRLVERFEISRKLGEGGMGQVWCAWDEARRTNVALKIIGELGPRSMGQAKREFRAACELVHPNLVRLHELFSDGPEWFFTMDLVEGVPLPRLLGTTALDDDALRSVFRQLASAIQGLHRAGTLHGDLKPSNFLITLPEHHVVLLDFGLARAIGPVQPNEFAGTPAYMAPEQKMGQILTEAADWYAYGVVLHEALTGQLPKRRPSLDALDRAPEDLARLALDLLVLDPQKRPSGAVVCRRLGAGSDSHVAAARASRPPLVGRSPELERLSLAFEQTVAGTPQIALVHGASGIGKTALVERFTEMAKKRGAIVLASRCRERESMRYKALDGLIDDLVVFLSSEKPAEAESFLPSGIAELTILFPALRVAEVIGKVPEEPITELDHAAVRQRAITAFRELLGELRKVAPLIVWIDDLQWGDEESAVLLARALGGPEPVPLFFIGSYRSGESRGPLLEALLSEVKFAKAATDELPLGPLTDEDAQRLALEMLSADADAELRARNIGREAGGHPMFITELAYVAAGSSGPDAAAAPASLSELIASRIDLLTPSARGFLDLCAIAGAPRARSVLRRAQGLAPAEAEEAMDVLRAARLARSQGIKEHDLVDIHHDRIRELVLSQLTETKQRALHLSLAEVLESESEPNPEAIAAHYELAGHLERAGTHWLEGAEQAAQALAFEHAAELYERGLGFAKLDSDERRAIAIRRAETLAYAGKGAVAASLYLETAAGCSGEQALELRRRAAEQLLLSGHLEQGLRAIEDVLTALRMRPTQSGRRALLSILAGRIRVRARGLRYRQREEAALSPYELARVDASWTIACSLAVVDFLRSADFQNRHLLLALRAGEPRRLLRALTLEVSFAATPGLGSVSRTKRLLELSGSLVEARADPAATGLFSLSQGIAAYLQGRTDEALRHCDAAVLTFTRHCSGAVWETVTARRFAIASMFFLGKMRRLADFVPPLLSEADATGNIYASVSYRNAYSTWAWLSRDQVAEARRQVALTEAQWSSHGFQIANYNILIGNLFTGLYEGDVEGARERLVRQWRSIEESQLLRIAIVRVQLVHLRSATAAAMANLQLGRGQRAAARAFVEEARAGARKLRRDPVPRAATFAALVDAAADRAEGRDESARARLVTSVHAFDEQGLSLFAAAARAHLARLTGGAQASGLDDAANRAWEAEGVVNPERTIAALLPGFPG